MTDGERMQEYLLEIRMLEAALRGDKTETRRARRRLTAWFLGRIRAKLEAQRAFMAETEEFRSNVRANWSLWEKDPEVLFITDSATMEEVCRKRAEQIGWVDREVKHAREILGSYIHMEEQLVVQLREEE